MATIDLKSMTRKELEKLKRDIDKALERITAKDLKAAKAAAEKVLKAQGFSLADVIDADAPKGKKRKTVKKPAKPSKPKYANPADQSQTWTGKGRQPEWYKAAIAAGTKPEAMAIKA